MAFGQEHLFVAESVTTIRYFLLCRDEKNLLLVEDLNALQRRTLNDELYLECIHWDEEHDAVGDEDVADRVPVLFVFVKHALKP